MALIACPNCGSDDLVKTATTKKSRQGMAWTTLTYSCKACGATIMLSYNQSKVKKQVE